MPKPRLWTPIANALEAYRRRVVIDPTAEYEHIWRLIHIQEALAVCLASLLASRLVNVLTDANGSDDMSSLRTALTGIRPGVAGLNDDDDTESSPWGGSIGAWIDVLRRFGESSRKDDDPFLSDLAAYLSSNPSRALAFGDGWARIAPIPSAFREPQLNRVGRLGAINSFRNKLAHVPVPQRLLGDLHRGLRVEVLDGLTEKFDPSSDATSFGFVATSYRDPLTGILYKGTTFVTGGNEVGIDTEPTSRPTTVHARYVRGRSAIEWPVEPFFRIDGEAKTALLFRVADLRREPGAAGYGGEYHRFAAELEPVTYLAIQAASMSPWIPGPAEIAPEEAAGPVRAQETGTPPAAETIEPPALAQTSSAVSPRELREKAEEAFSRRLYSLAASAFDALAALGESAEYNDVARSKHGAALWRAAEHQSQSPDELQASLASAITLLERAERHRDPRYAARSAYERSKALWHLWRSTNDPQHLSDSLAAAEKAVAKSPEEAFISWQSRVKSDASVAIPQA